MDQKFTQIEINEEMVKQVINEEEKAKFSNIAFFSFDKLYRGIKIKNLTNNPNALYYTFKINNSTFLQTHMPYVQGFQAITEENKNTISNNHKTKLNNSHNKMIKFKKALKNLKEKNKVKL